MQRVVVRYSGQTTLVLGSPHRVETGVPLFSERFSPHARNRTIDRAQMGSKVLGKLDALWSPFPELEVTVSTA